MIVNRVYSATAVFVTWLSERVNKDGSRVENCVENIYASGAPFMDVV